MKLGSWRHAFECCQRTRGAPSLTLHLYSECDAPLTLINATFDWLAANFKGQIDFVVLTGDNARHDIDLRFPRSLREIYSVRPPTLPLYSCLG